MTEEEVLNQLESLPITEKKRLLKALANEANHVAQEDFLSYVRYMDPNFCEGRHHQLIADRLHAVESGQLKRLMIFMPPRSGKSYLVSKHFPAWFLGRRPNKQILSVSYGIDLAEDWGRFVRNALQSDEFQRVFPGITVTSDSRAAVRWDTTKGGVYRAAGVGGGIAGKGASLAIIDDPLNEQDAYSKAARERVIRWYPGGLRTRLMPGGSILLTMTRWHEDDLAGWLERNSQEDWEILRIPALLDEEGSSLLGYPLQTSYWPPHPNPPEGAELIGWSTEELVATKEAMPPNEWESLYQQNPTIEGGNILKTEYWQEWESKEPPECHYIFLTTDTAFEKTSTADYSAYVVWGVFYDPDTKQPNLIMLSARKGRWEFHELRQKITKAYHAFDCDALVVEKKASGQSLIQELRRTGLPVMPFQPDKDKEARAHASVPIMYNERVYYPKNKEWANDVIQECASFPAGKYDDYVDCVTMAVLWVRDGMFLYTTDEPWGEEEEEDYRRPKSYY